MFHHQDGILTFCSDDDEKSEKELNSLSLAPERADPRLLSELVDTREVRLVSMLSQIIVDAISTLGLPELMNDISVTNSENSAHDLPVNALPLANGDLYSEKCSGLVF